MIIDEIGCLRISRTRALLSFHLMSRRHEHARTALMSNKGFEQWGEALGDDVMAAPIDRLLHHCHIVKIHGNSYRMCEHRALATRLSSPPVSPLTPHLPGESAGGQASSRAAAPQVCNFSWRHCANQIGVDTQIGGLSPLSAE